MCKTKVEGEEGKLVNATTAVMVFEKSARVGGIQGNA